MSSITSHASALFSAQRDCNRLLSGAADIGAVMTSVLDVLDIKLGFRRGGLFVRDASGAPRALAHATNGRTNAEQAAEITRIESALAQARGRSVVGAVLANGDPVIFDDVAAATVYLEADRAMRSELCIPITLKGELFGALNVESEQRAAFDNDDLTMLQTVALQLGMRFHAALAEGDLFAHCRTSPGFGDMRKTIIGA